MALTSAELREVATQAAAAALVAVGTTTAVPSKRLKEFGSTSPKDWVAWKDNFKIISKLNKWNDERARAELGSSMIGDAKTFVQHIPLDIDGDNTKSIKELLQAYEDTFLPLAEEDMNRSNFNKARQGETEDLAAWHNRVRCLYIRMYPEMTMAKIDLVREVITTFIKGLFDGQIRLAVISNNPKTFDDARISAQAITAALSPENQRENSIVAMDRDPLVAATPAPHQRRAQPWQECFGCRRKGHFQNDCPDSKTGPRNGGVRQRHDSSRSRGGWRGRGRRGGRGRGRGGNFDKQKIYREGYLAALDNGDEFKYADKKTENETGQ